MEGLGPRTYPESSYEHIKGGYYGDYLTLEAAMEPLGEWEELIVLFARTVVAAEAKLDVK